MQNYSFKRKPYMLLVIAILIILLPTAYISSYPSWKMIIYKMLFSLYFAFFSIMTIEIPLRQLVHYTFVIDNPLWRKEVDRPRVAFLAISLTLALFSFDLVTTRGTEPMQFWINTIFGCLMLIGAIGLLTLPYNKKNETSILLAVRRQLHQFHDIECTINSREFDTATILSELSDKFDTSLDVFEALINLKHIEPRERIIAKIDKTELVRFTYVLFNIKDKESKMKRQFINTYFVDEKGKDFILESDATFPKINQEVLEKKNPYRKTKEFLNAIIEGNRKTKN